jgi:antitoxin MazE
MNKQTEVKNMPLVKVKRYCQITLPSLIRKRFNIDEGDYLEIEEKDGNMVLKPVRVVHPESAYFYSKEWQADEAEADKDIAAGKMLGPFDTIDDFAKAIKA